MITPDVVSPIQPLAPFDVTLAAYAILYPRCSAPAGWDHVVGTSALRAFGLVGTPLGRPHAAQEEAAELVVIAPYVVANI